MGPGRQEPTTHSPRRQINLCNDIQILAQRLSAFQLRTPLGQMELGRALESGRACGLSMVTETRIPGLGPGLGEKLKNPQ